MRNPFIAFVPGADCVQVCQRAEGHYQPLPAPEDEGRREGQPLVARQKRTGSRLAERSARPRRACSAPRSS